MTRARTMVTQSGVVSEQTAVFRVSRGGGTLKRVVRLRRVLSTTSFPRTSSPSSAVGRWATASTSTSNLAPPSSR